MEVQYKVLIVDDEEPARSLLESYVSKRADLQVQASVNNALDAKKHIDLGGVDILLSDIQMDDLSGIDLLKNLKNKPVTIFTTAFSEYALEGYELDVIDYLVKPISFQRFCKAIDKAIELIAYSNRQPNTNSVAEYQYTQTSEFFFVKTNRKLVKVNYSELLFVESFGEYVKLYTHNDVLLAAQPMNYMEEVLPANDFIRVHRSHIVNINHINEVDGNTIKVDAFELTVSSRMRADFLSAIGKTGLI